MARSICLAEYIQADLHQIVTAVLLVLTYIVNGTVVAFVWRNQAILVALKNHRLHAIVVLDCILHKLVVISSKRLEVDIKAQIFLHNNTISFIINAY